MFHLQMKSKEKKVQTMVKILFIVTSRKMLRQNLHFFLKSSKIPHSIKKAFYPWVVMWKILIKLPLSLFILSALLPRVGQIVLHGIPESHTRGVYTNQSQSINHSSRLTTLLINQTTKINQSSINRQIYWTPNQSFLTKPFNLSIIQASSNKSIIPSTLIIPFYPQHINLLSF